VTIGEYIRDLAQNFAAWEVRLQVGDSRYTAAEFSQRLDAREGQCALVTESGGDGCFILDPSSQRRVIQVHWSPKRRGWYVKRWPPNTRVHCYKMASCYLVSLCGVTATPADSSLLPDPPTDSSLCKTCARLEQDTSNTAYEAGTQTI
jgi:hypothetical protein